MKLLSIRNSVLLFLWLLLVMAQANPWQQKKTQIASAPIAGATVADLKGKVHVQVPGQALSVPTRGQVLPAETTISTEGGSILLRLEDGSQILVNEHTRLFLEQPSPSSWQRLQLFLGRIKAEIQKRVGGSPPFQMGTPSAVISVRGTSFNVLVDKHKTTKVAVEEGEVQLESTKGIGKPVLIQAGHKSQVKQDSEPESPQEAPQLKHSSGNSNNGRDNSSHGMGNPSGPRGGGRRP